MNKLNAKQEVIHNRAVKLSRTHRRVEQQLIEVLILVDETRLYRELDKASLFLYATELLHLSEAVAYALISVARKSAELPALRCAIAEQKLSASKASRIVAHMTPENAEELIDFASTHTS